MVTTLNPPQIDTELAEQWHAVRKHFHSCIRKTGYVSIGSVNAAGQPTISPIGSLYLNHDLTGYYFELFTTSIAKNHRHNPQVCVMAADGGKGFWLKSLWKGRFSRPPAMKLHGTAGKLRPATEEEKERFRKLVKPLRWLKGHDMLWGKLENVREIQFYKVEKARLGKMTK